MILKPPHSGGGEFTYKHHYAMLLPVAGMIEEGAIGLTPEKVAAALRALADGVEAGREDLVQFLGGGGPVHCEREDRWVWRAADRPHIIRKASGGWVEVDSTMIDLEDSVTGARAARIMALSTPAQREDSVWCRPEDIGGIALVADLGDARGDVRFGTDMREFLAKGDETLVEALARDGCWDAVADDVIEAMAEEDDPAALAMLDHLERAPAADACSSLRITFRDPEAATAFLKEVRPDLHKAIFEDSTPEI